MSPVTYGPPPAPPPAICQGAAFADLIGTAGPDRIEAPARAVRVWGLGGADRLFGSATRASCLIGGDGNDVLFLNGGGGVAYGGRGRDLVFGSDLGDVIDPGKDPDGVAAGGGDDKITTRDGHPELVDCGAGNDIVKADRSDLLTSCESTNLGGRGLPHFPVRPAEANNADDIRFRLRVTKPGIYRVLSLDACPTAGATVAEFGRVRRTRSAIVRAPAAGWCRGTMHLGVVRDPGNELPVQPVARLSFKVF